MQVVRRNAPEVAALLMQRNLLAAALQGDALPDMLRDERACKGCFQLANCALLHKVTF